MFYIICEFFFHSTYNVPGSHYTEVRCHIENMMCNLPSRKKKSLESELLSIWKKIWIFCYSNTINANNIDLCIKKCLVWHWEDGLISILLVLPMWAFEFDPCNKLAATHTLNPRVWEVERRGSWSTLSRQSSRVDAVLSLWAVLSQEQDGKRPRKTPIGGLPFQTFPPPWLTFLV